VRELPTASASSSNVAFKCPGSALFTSVTSMLFAVQDRPNPCSCLAPKGYGFIWCWHLCFRSCWIHDLAMHEHLRCLQLTRALSIDTCGLLCALVASSLLGTGWSRWCLIKEWHSAGGTPEAQQPWNWHQQEHGVIKYHVSQGQLRAGSHEEWPA
jgi:hypothetical protein